MANSSIGVDKKGDTTKPSDLAKIEELKHQLDLPAEFFLFDNVVIKTLMKQNSDLPLATRAKNLMTTFEEQSARLLEKYPNFFAEHSQNNVILLLTIIKMSELNQNKKLFEDKIDSMILRFYEVKDNHQMLGKLLAELQVPNYKEIADAYCYTIQRDGYSSASSKTKIDIGEWAQMLCAVAPFGFMASDGIGFKKLYQGKRSVPIDIFKSILKLPSSVGLNFTNKLDNTSDSYTSIIGQTIQNKSSIFGFKSQSLAFYQAILACAPRYISPANAIPWLLNSVVWGGTLLVEIPLKTLAAAMSNLILMVSKPLTDKDASFGSKALSFVGTLIVGAIFYLPSQILFAVGNLVSYTRNIFDGLTSLISLGFAKLGEKLFKESHVEKYASATFSLQTVLSNIIFLATGGLPFLAGAATTAGNKLSSIIDKSLDSSAKEEIEKNNESIKEQQKILKESKSAIETPKLNGVAPEVSKVSDSSAQVLSQLPPSPPIELTSEEKQEAAIQSWINAAKASLDKVEQQMQSPPSILQLNSQLLALKKDTGEIILSDLKDSDPKKAEVTEICKQLEDKQTKLDKLLQPTQSVPKEKENTSSVEIEMTTPVRSIK